MKSAKRTNGIQPKRLTTVKCGLYFHMARVAKSMRSSIFVPAGISSGSTTRPPSWLVRVQVSSSPFIWIELTYSSRCLFLPLNCRCGIEAMAKGSSRTGCFRWMPKVMSAERISGSSRAKSMSPLTE